MLRILKYELRNVARARWLLAYGLFFLGVTEALLRFGGGGERALLSLLNVVLLVVPLASVLLGITYLYNATEFTKLLLAQPVRRGELFAGLFIGLSLPMAIVVVLGMVIPFALRGFAGDAVGSRLITLCTAVVFLTLIFVALAYLVAVVIRDRVKGLAVALLAWLVLAVAYDGGVLLLANAFAAYPLEKPILVLMLLNPVDLARVVLLMRFDVAALMGYTGAVFESFFGGSGGAVVALASLCVWFVVPFLAGMHWFARRDF
jgi:Cu-processing system permease protein